MTPDQLAELPGYGRDAEKSRAEARRLLAEAGVPDLKFKLINRTVNHPFTPAGVYVVDQFRRIGVTAEHQQLDVSQQKASIASGDFQVAIDAFCADSDDPKPLFLPYLSKERSPRNMTRNQNPEFDALYDKFSLATDEKTRAALAATCNGWLSTRPTACRCCGTAGWWRTCSAMKGWKIIPTHFANQDLADDLARPVAGRPLSLPFFPLPPCRTGRGNNLFTVANRPFARRFGENLFREFASKRND